MNPGLWTPEPKRIYFPNVILPRGRGPDRQDAMRIGSPGAMTGGMSGLMSGSETQLLGANGDTPPAVAGYTDWWISTQTIFSDVGGTTPCTNGSTVENWTAGGSRADVLLETQTHKFTFSTNQVNGRPALIQPGTQDAELAATYALSQPFTIIIVANNVQYNSVFRMWGKGADGPQLWQANSSPNIQLYANNVAACTASFTIGTWGIISCVLNGASSSIKVNNGSRNTGNPGNQAMTAFSAGAPSNASMTNWAEIVIYASALSAADETSVMDGFNARYAIY